MFVNQATPYYEPSGRAPGAGVVLFLLVGIFAAWILGVVYTVVLAYIPFIFISILGTVGFGGGLGVVCLLLVRGGKLRAPFNVSIFAAIVTFMGLWLHWAFFSALFVHRAVEESPGLMSLYLFYLSSPAEIIGLAKVLLADGHFSIGKSSSTNVAGAMLGGLWLIEALIIFGCTVYLARAQAKEPFSEASDRWAEKEDLPRVLPHVEDHAGMKIALETGDFSPLLNAPAKDDNDPRHAQLTLHTVEDDPDCRYLTLVNVTIITDKKGKEQRKSVTVVQHLHIRHELCQKLRDMFGPDSQAELPVSPESPMPSEPSELP